MKPWFRVGKRTTARHVVISLFGLAALLLLAQPTVAETRFRATNAQTLLFTSSVDDDLVKTLRGALNDYRSEQRRNQLVVVRPLAQQSTEVGILRDHLRALGYYNHEITPRPTDDYTELRYQIRTGRVFRLRQIEWDWPDDVPTPLPAQGSLRAGQAIIAQDILDAQAQLRREIQAATCYLRVNVRYELSLDRVNNTGNIRFFMEPSEQVNIGAIRIEGLETVASGWAARLTQLQPGQCFQRRAMDQARLAMYQSNLFVQINEEISPPIDGQVDVTFTVQERFHRTIKLGGGYDTDSGIGVSAEWTHRNFDGRGENLILGSQWSLLTQAVSATYIIPRRQPFYPRFTLSSRLEQTIFDETPTVVWQNGISLEQILSPSWTATVGGNLRSTWLRADTGTEYDQWLALPLSVVRDTRDDVLDPRRGSRFLVSSEPNWSLSDTQPDYARWQTGFRGYQSVFDPLTLAISAEVTSLSGISGPLNFEQLSESERLFAGGGGSVRGWPFQEAGVPGGGRLRVLNSVEQRWRFLQNWGVVAFVDSAWLSNDGEFRLEDRVSGAGFGLRYFTNFAPLRLDVASPLPDWGNEWSFYISIGQSF
ncbi:BamA/TamA family outer membrane protein [Salinispirillum sp. LH 10-3-1]|uniref:BamA/TamA family outer membrane protein n=1 Tax=Salinispirillum sp. LH 10-3-1 TaxID=2952525 RepID=A0AB38YIU5_9GAMM